MHPARSALLCGVLLGATFASTARAQADVDRGTARSLGNDGATALAAKDYKTAEADFRKADSILYISCFDANGGLFEPLLGEQDAVISDELNHASIRPTDASCAKARHRVARRPSPRPSKTLEGSCSRCPRASGP